MKEKKYFGTQSPWFTEKKLFMLLIIILWCVNIPAQVGDSSRFQDKYPERRPDDGTIRLVFYNCENLFDYRDDPGSGDDDFASDGLREWNFWRYRQRLIATARVLLHCGGWDPPDLIGLAEIENRRVLSDLIRLTPLSKTPYGIVHFESPDFRGIDVALLYRRDRFRPSHAQPLRFNLEEDGLTKTRDILYINLLTLENDTFHLFVNHWPSRFGGHLQTIPKRIAAAKRLARITDSLLTMNSQSRLIVCGDFNDEPGDSSLHILTHRSPPQKSLINLMDQLSMIPGQGSHKHAGSWGFLDQILVSAPLVSNTSSWGVEGKAAWILETPYLLEKEERNPGYRPYRAFAGTFFQGGFSDHLPVFIQIRKTDQSETRYPHKSSLQSTKERGLIKKTIRRPSLKKSLEPP